jgi:uncharacterized protein (DUF169 family)
MSNFNEIGRELDRMLRLRTTPLGIKYFKEIEDVPDEFEKIDQQIPICQLMGVARYHEKAVYTDSDMATACAGGGALQGFYDLPADFADGSRCAGWFARDVQATRKIFENRMSIEKGKFKALGAAPLATMTVEPDVVQVFGNPHQMLSLVYANTWDGSDDIKLGTNGHGACCYEVLVVPYLTGEVRLAIADIGERRYAMAADDEMIMGIPIAHLGRLYENLQAAYKAVYKYPLKYNFPPLPEPALRWLAK